MQKGSEKLTTEYVPAPAVYFPNLNGIRFLAAALVMVHHSEQIKTIFNLDSAWESSECIRSLGHIGVLLFFTLSGFLITYLLLEEETVYGKVDIGKFYVRRILRIWPLYFLIFLSAYFVFNKLEFFHYLDVPTVAGGVTLICFTFFLSNWYLAAFGILPFAAQTWSVSTEEQFYLLWPWILRWSSRRMRTLLFIMIIVTAVRVFLLTKTAQSIPYHQEIKSFWNMFNIECMAIGGLFAFLLFKHKHLLRFILTIGSFSAALLIAVLQILFSYKIPVVSSFFQNEFYALLFAVVIVNCAANPLLENLLEKNWISYLGKISYGLYMYHWLCFVLVIKLLFATKIKPDLLILPLGFCATVVLSHFSYQYFERPFLRKKQLYAKVIT